MAQKYIIGDLIKYKVGGLEFIAEITNTSKYGYCFKGVSDDISGTLCKEFAKDIPLTPEILEKNGWYGVTHSKQSDDTTKILYKTFKRKGYPTIKTSQDLKIICELSPFIIKLESVSDLQHLLFGLGLNSEMEVDV